MKYFLALTVLLTVCYSCDKQRLQEGDLLFQTSTGSSLSKAIDKVTQIDSLQGYVHVGMLVLVRNNCDKRRCSNGGSSSSGGIYGGACGNSSFCVIEATGKGVCLTPLDSFLSRNAKTDIYRLQKQYQALIPKAIEYSIRQTGKPYDSAFLPDTNKFYCSELISEAFRYANGNRQFFESNAMTFKAKGEFLPEWVEWYQHLGIAIPEGVQGSNPTGISRDKRLIKTEI